MTELRHFVCSVLMNIIIYCHNMHVLSAARVGNYGAALKVMINQLQDMDMVSSSMPHLRVTPSIMNFSCIVFILKCLLFVGWLF